MIMCQDVHRPGKRATIEGKITSGFLQRLAPGRRRRLDPFANLLGGLSVARRPVRRLHKPDHVDEGGTLVAFTDDSASPAEPCAGLHIRCTAATLLGCTPVKQVVEAGRPRAVD